MLTSEICEHNFGEWKPVGHLDQRRCDKCHHVEEKDYTGDIVFEQPPSLDPVAIKLIAAMNEIERLRTALEWYGDEKNWGHFQFSQMGDFYITRSAEDDHGSLARRALKGEE